MIELHASLPPEPAMKSVVLSAAGQALQRTPAGWLAVGQSISLPFKDMSWMRVLETHGPVRWIWDGDTQAPPTTNQGK